MASVIWFRRDLRVHDHPALLAAMEAGPVAPLFLVDDRLIHGRWPSPNRVAFLLESLRALDAELRARGTLLHVRRGRPAEVVPGFAAEVGAEHVFASRDYGPYARRRDGQVARELEARGGAFQASPGVLVHEPEQIQKDDGTPFAVFTPFFPKWLMRERREVSPGPEGTGGVRGIEAGALPSLAELGLNESAADLPPGGEAAARERLQSWVESGLEGYAAGRICSVSQVPRG